jgi:hypothetical protein
MSIEPEDVQAILDAAGPATLEELNALLPDDYRLVEIDG